MAEPQSNFERLLLLAEKDPAAAMMLDALTSAPQDPFKDQVIDPVQPGSPMAMMSGMPPPAPQPQQPLIPTAPPPEPELMADLFSGRGGPGIFNVQPQPAPEPESDNPLIAIPRGVARGVGQTALSIGEGLFNIADAATNVVGFDDALDPETSEAIKTIKETRELIGNETTVAGKVAEALGSIVMFAIPGFGQAGAAARGVSLAAKGTEFLSAANRANALAKGLKGVKWGFAAGAGSGQAAQMIDAYKEAGGEYTMGQRNLAIALGIPIGALELLPIEGVLRGLPNLLPAGTKNSIIKDIAQRIDASTLGSASVTGLTEGTQEVVSSLLQEYAAKFNYDPDIEIGESMLSDFGYGASAGAIFDLMLKGTAKRLRTKSENKINQEYEDAPAIEPVNTDLLAQAQQQEQVVKIYDENGEEVEAEVMVIDEENGVAQMLVDEETINVPLNNLPGLNGYSFSKDSMLMSPKYITEGGEGVEVGGLNVAELADARNYMMLNDELKAAVDAGEMSVAEAAETAAEEGMLTAQLTPQQHYDLKALTEELNRKNPTGNYNVSEETAKDLARAEEDIAIDDGSLGEGVKNEVDRRVEAIAGEGDETVIGRTAAPSGDRALDIETSSIEKRFKSKRVPKKDQPALIELVTGDPKTPLEQLTQDQRIRLYEAIDSYVVARKARQEEEKEAKGEPAPTPAPTPTPTPTPVDTAQDPVDDTVTAEDTIVDVPDRRVKNPSAPTPKTKKDPNFSENGEYIIEYEDGDVRKIFKNTDPDGGWWDAETVNTGGPRGIMTGHLGWTKKEALEKLREIRQSEFDSYTDVAPDEAIGDTTTEPAAPKYAFKQPTQVGDQYVITVIDKNKKGDDQIEVQETVSKQDVNGMIDAMEQQYGIKAPNKHRLAAVDESAVSATAEELASLENVVISSAIEGKEDEFRSVLNRKYISFRGQGLNHLDSINKAIESDDMLDLRYMARPRSRYDVDKTKAPVDVEAVPDAETMYGPAIYVPKKRIALDINEANEVQNIIRKVAGPQARMVIADQLYGLKGAVDDKETIIPEGLEMVNYNGQNILAGRALGLQTGNIVAVALEDGHLDVQNRAYHESTHFLLNNGFLTDSEVKVLMNNVPLMESVVRKELGEQGMKDAFAMLNEKQTISELVAYTSAAYSRAMDTTGKPPKEIKRQLHPILQKIYELFKQVKNYFTANPPRTEITDVLETIRSGAASSWRREGDATQDLTGLSNKTPLYMVKQGDNVTQSKLRPTYKSKLINSLKSAGNPKQLPKKQAAKNWFSIGQGGKIEGILAKSGIKKEELLDANLNVFFDPDFVDADEVITSDDILNWVEEQQTLVEIQMYGPPIDLVESQEAIIAKGMRKDRENKAINDFLEEIIFTADPSRLSRESASYTKEVFTQTQKDASTVFLASEVLYQHNVGKDKNKPFEGTTKQYQEVIKSAEKLEELQRKQAVRVEAAEPVSTMIGLTGDYVGQMKLLTTTNALYKWNGSDWDFFTGSGSGRDVQYVIPESIGVGDGMKELNPAIRKFRSSLESAIKSEDPVLTRGNLIEMVSDRVKKFNASEEVVGIDKNLNADIIKYNIGKYLESYESYPLRGPQDTSSDALLRSVRGQPSQGIVGSAEEGFSEYDKPYGLMDSLSKQYKTDPYYRQTSLGKTARDMRVGPDSRGSGYGDKYRTIVVAAPFANKDIATQGAKNDSSSAHYPTIINPVLHIRLNEVTTEDGKRILIVEEIQSDIHQEAAEAIKHLAAERLFFRGWRGLTRDEKNQVRKYISDNEIELRSIVYDNTYYPDVPLKDENQRIRFAMNIVTKMAAKGLYDGIAVANSDSQITRYRASYKDHVNSLLVTPQIPFDTWFNQGVISQHTDGFDLVDQDTIGMSLNLPELNGILPDGSNAIDKYRSQGKIYDRDAPEGRYPDVTDDGKVSFIKLPISKIKAEINLLRNYVPMPPSFDESGNLLNEEYSGMLGVKIEDPVQREAIISRYDTQEGVMQGAYSELDRLVSSMVNVMPIKNPYVGRGEPSPFSLSGEDFNVPLSKAISETSSTNTMPNERISNVPSILFTRSPIAGRKLFEYAFQRALAREYPDFATIYNVQYTTPIMGGSPVYRGGIEIEGNEKLDTFLGEGMAELVRSELTFGNELFIPSIELYVNAKIQDSLDLQKVPDNELDPEELIEKKLLNNESVKTALQTLEGRIDIPLNNKFVNKYDSQIPKAVRDSIASLLPYPKKTAQKKVNKKFLYLPEVNALYGSDGFGYMPAKIIDPEVQGDRKVRGAFGPTPSVPIDMDRAYGLDDGLGDRFFDNKDPQEQIEDQTWMALSIDEGEAAKERLIPMRIPISHKRNMFTMYELSDEAIGSDKLIEPDEIYFARKNNERNMSTNAGIDNNNTVTKNWRDSVVDWIDTIPVLNALKSLPDKRDFLLKKAEYTGVVSRSEEIATFLRNEIGNKFLNRKGPKNRQDTKILRTTIFKYMTEGEEAAEQELFKQLQSLDKRAAAAAKKAKEMIENLGLELMDKGLLRAETFYTNRRSYLPRIYLKHVLEDKRDTAFSYLKQRSDVSQESREALGEINELDPAFLVSRAIQRPIRDLALIEFFDSITTNSNWVLKNDEFLIPMEGPDGEVKNYSGFYLIDQMATMTEIANTLQAADPERAESLRMQVAKIEEAIMPVLGPLAARKGKKIEGLAEEDIPALASEFADMYKRVPRNKKFGMLQGMAVRKEIYDDVIASNSILAVGDAATVQFGTLGKQATAVWKTIKVPLNPPTIARNTFSNMILMHLSGVPFFSVIPRMVEAANEIRSYNKGDYDNSKHYAEMLKRGVKQSTMSDQELIRMSDDMLDFLSSVDAKDLGAFGWLKLKTWDRLSSAGSKFYQGLEVLGKTAIAIDVMEREGLSADDAYLRAQEYLFDYGDVPGLVKYLRTSPLGIPFLTFQYKVLPALVKTAVRNPFKFAPYAAMAYALPHLMMSAFDIDDDDYEEIKEVLPDYIRGNPGLLPVPIRDEKGRIQFLDTSYLYPWGSFATLGNEGVKLAKAITGNKDYTEKGFNVQDITSTFGLFGGPAWSVGFGMANLDPFTQREITNPNDPLWISNAEDRPFYRRGKVTDYAYWAANQYILPGFLNTEYGAVSKILNASGITGGEFTRGGVTPDAMSQSVLRLIGLNLIKVDPDQVTTSLEYLVRGRTDVVSAKNSVAKDQSLSPNERLRRMENYNQQIFDYNQKIVALTEASRTAVKLYKRLNKVDSPSEIK
jgi:Asp-tRNA(Asn)/Glu-tRNA(Gln) amidotransferase C subunit